MCLEHFLQTKANIGGYGFPNITILYCSDAAVLTESQAFHFTHSNLIPFIPIVYKINLKIFSLIFILATAGSDSWIKQQLYSDCSTICL